MFKGVLPLYFVRSVSGSRAFIFRIHYIHSSTTHGGAALIFRTLYPWLYEVIAQESFYS